MSDRPDLAAITRRFEWGCEPPQCSDDRAAMLVWIGQLERDLAAARAELAYTKGWARSAGGSMTYWAAVANEQRAALAAARAVTDAAVRFCSFSGESIISDENDQAWNDLSDAVDVYEAAAPARGGGP